MKKIAAMREDYMLKSLDIKDVLADPFSQFKVWFDEALNSDIPEPNAMTLATASGEGYPSARVVLLKGLEKDGFVFYTNYKSRKGQEMSENPHVALVFCWLELQRQILIEGTVAKITKKQSEEYFQSRPRESQIGAWSSPQSTPIHDRQVLVDNADAIEKQFEGIAQLPLPKFWGGYIVKPTAIEFWQGRSSRLHDRIRYRKVKRSWKIERLAP
jgi:pyridoxamine 5'-phosphate oxidase